MKATQSVHGWGLFWYSCHKCDKGQAASNAKGVLGVLWVVILAMWLWYELS